MRRAFVILEQRQPGRPRPIAVALRRDIAEGEASKFDDHYVTPLPLVEETSSVAPTATAHHFEVSLRREGPYYRAVAEDGTPETPWVLCGNVDDLGRNLMQTSVNIVGTYNPPKGKP